MIVNRDHAPQAEVRAFPLDGVVTAFSSRWTMVINATMMESARVVDAIAKGRSVPSRSAIQILGSGRIGKSAANSFDGRVRFVY